MCSYDDVTQPTDSPMAVALCVNGRLIGTVLHDGPPVRP